MPAITCEFHLPGMHHCCKTTVEIAVKNCSLPIESLTADPASNHLTVTVDAEGYDESQVREIIRWAVEDAGYVCLDRRSLFHSHWVRGFTGTGLGLTLMILMMVTGTWPMGLMIAVGLVALILTVVLGWNSIQAALREWRESRRLTMHSLFLVSTLTAMAASVVSFFVPGVPMMFDVGLMIFGFRHLGDGIEESLTRHMGFNRRYQDRAPRRVKKRRADGTYIEIDLNDVQPNDEILVEQGVIPVDGVCLSEGCILNVSFESGYPFPHHAALNEPLKAGVELEPGSPPLHLRVTEPFARSLLALRDQEMAQELSEKSPLEIRTNQFMQYFVPAVLGVGFLAGIALASLVSPALGIHCGVLLMVSACPCTFSMVIPLAMRIGVNKVSEPPFSARLKSAKHLQDAQGIDAVVFDMNGTVTQEKLEVLGVHTVGETAEENLLATLAALEAHASHPVAEAICQYVRNKGILAEGVFEHVEKYPFGIKATLGDSTMLVGNTDMLREHHIVIPEASLQTGGRPIYLVSDGIVKGWILVHSPLRKDAVETFRLLASKGIKTYLCTGDSLENATVIAAQLGVPVNHIFAGCKAGKDKKSVIENLRGPAGSCRVAMVGDAGNDGPAMKSSHFSIAVKSSRSDPTVRQNAGAVISGQSLLAVPKIFMVADQTLSTVYQNLGFSLTYNVAVMALSLVLLVGIGFAINPGIGVALMILQTSLILMNTWRFKTAPLKGLPLTEEPDNPDSYFSLMHQMPKSGCEVSPKQGADKVVLSEPNSALFQPAEEPDPRLETFEDAFSPH